MTTAVDHPLRSLLSRAAKRSFPAPDGKVDVFGPPPGRCDVALAFPGHAVVAADVPEDWVHAHVPDGWADEHDHDGALSVHFLGALSDRLGSAPAGLTVLVAAPKGPQAGTRAQLRPGGRVNRKWAAYRTDVRSYTDADGRGVVNIGHGPAGRLDIWIEVEGGSGSWIKAPAVVRGRDLLAAARVSLTPEDGELFASVPAHNARALRTFLGGGFRPIGAEVLYLTRQQA